MSEIGILQLDIQDNSKQAGEGLEGLAKALGRVKAAVGKGLDLSPVSTAIIGLNNLIKEDVGAGALIKNLGTLFNAVSKYSKQFSEATKTINVQPLKDVKEAINGLNIGNSGSQLDKLQGALTKSWGSAKAVTSMKNIVEAANAFATNDTATKLSVMVKPIANIATSITAFADAQEKLASVGGGLSGITDFAKNVENFAKEKPLKEAKKEVVDYLQAVKDFDETMGSGGTLTFREPKYETPLPVNLGQFGYKDITGQTGADLGNMLSSGFATAEATVSKVRENVETIRAVLVETRDIVTSIPVQQIASDISSNIDKNLSQYIAGPLESLRDRYQHTDIISESFRDVAPQLETIGAQTKIATAHIAKLFDVLERPIDYKNLSNLVNEIAGIGRQCKITQEELSVFETEASQKINSLMSYLEHPINYGGNRLREVIENSLGINQKIDRSHDADMLFKYSDELERRYQVVERIRNTMDKLNKPIDYSNLENAINTGFGIGRQGMTEDDVRLLLDNAEAINENKIAYSELKEIVSAQSSTGIKESMVPAKEADEYATAMAMAAHQAQRVAVSQSAWANASAETKEYIASLIGMRPEQIWGTTATNATAAAAAVNGVATSMNQYGNAAKEASSNVLENNNEEFVANLTSQYSALELMRIRLEGMKQALADDITMNRLSTQQIAERTIQIQKLSDKIEELRHSTSLLSRTFKGLGTFINNLGITKLTSQIFRTAKSRMIRMAIRQIASGLKEGVQNVYNYSKAIGTSFAPAMDEAATALQYMKNSVGASAAPLIQSLIPYLQILVDGFVEVLNYANQFFALLRGQNTWTRALPATTTAFGKQEKAAKGAANAIKDLLADWDELNIIQSESSGGGLGTSTVAAEEYLNMFEEVGEFNNDIKRIVEWIQDHMALIKDLAIAIGAAIIAWKLSSAFTKGIGELQGLALEGLGLAVGLILSWDGAYQAGIAGGFDTDTLIETASGIVMETISGALIGWRLGGPWGAVIGGATGLIVSLGVAITAYYDGERTRKLRAKWGKVTLTQAQIDELVENQVSTKVSVELEIMKTSIKNREAARTKANLALASLGVSLDAVKFAMAADSSDSGINDALETAKNAVGAIQEKLDTEKEGLKLSFTKFKYKDSNGNDVTAELYSNMLKGTMALDTFFTGMGDDIASYLAKGFSEGLTREEELMALDLMTTLNRITEKARANYEKGRLIRESERDMDNFYSMDSAEAVLGRQKERLRDYQNTVIDQMQQDLESNYEYLEYYRSMQEYFTEKGDESKVKEYAQYIQDRLTAIGNLEDWLGQIGRGEYNWHMDESYSGMYNRMMSLWTEKFQEFYKEAFLQSLYNDNVESPFDNNPVASDILSYFGFSPESLLSEEELDAYYKYLVGVFGDNTSAIMEEIQSKGLTFNNAMLSKYLTDEYLGGIKEDEIVENVKTGIFGMLLTGTAQESKLWKSMFAEMKNAYANDDLVEKTYEESIGELSALYESMVSDMFAGMSKDDFLNKYASNALFANAFVNEFKDSFDMNTDGSAEEYVGNMKETIETAAQEAEASLEELLEITGEEPYEILPIITIDPIDNPIKDAIEEEDINIWDLVDIKNTLPEEEEVDIWDLTGRLAGFDPRKASASAGAWDVWPTGSSVSTGEEEAAMADGVKAGTNEGFQRLSENLETVATWLQRLYNKDTTVKITPSSTAGLWTQVSNMLLSNVTGEVGG